MTVIKAFLISLITALSMGNSQAQATVACFSTYLSRASLESYRLIPNREPSFGLQWVIVTDPVVNRVLNIRSTFGVSPFLSSAPVPYNLPSLSGIDFVRVEKSLSPTINCPVELHSVRALDPVTVPALGIWSGLLLGSSMLLLGAHSSRR
jgi:hypothetical protein